MKEKRGIPRDQQVRELLSVYHTMTHQPHESVADFTHRFSETQHELDTLIPGIHNAGINLTGYHPPPGFYTKMCAQPQGFCTTENARGPGH